MIEPERESTSRPDPLGQAYLLLDSRIQQVEESLSATFDSTVELIPEVSRHLIASGGKRIRPVMLLLCAEAVGANHRQQAKNLAVASELLHNATLLHDDVVDRSDLRRGVPSAPNVYGNSASVLVGDYLLARALGLVVDYGDLQLMEEFSQMLASMAEGEVLQLIRSGRLSVSLPEYVEIISGKTAGLFSWCGRAGASLLDADNSNREALTRRSADFGLAFGMAFQVTDDILDYTASPEQSGKDLANDLLQGKATLPLLLACREDPALQNLVDHTAESGQPSAEACQQIVERVLASDSIGQSMDEANRYASKAKDELSRFKKCQATDILADLADFVVARVMR